MHHIATRVNTIHLARGSLAENTASEKLTSSIIWAAAAWQVVDYDDPRGERSESTLLTGWPKQAGYKVPSELSYSDTPAGHRQWGFDIDPKSERMVWTKLQFDIQPRDQELKWILRALDGMKDMKMNVTGPNGQSSNDFPTYEAVDIASDYLKRVRKWVISDMERQYGRGYIDKLNTEIVVTIPAVSTTKPKENFQYAFKL